jgi:hypothetical protein
MFLGMTTGGTMLFFSVVTAIGLVWVYFFLPETTGKSLEALDEMFNLPWHLIGRKGAQLTRGTGGLADTLDVDGEKAAEARIEEVGGYDAERVRMSGKV